MGINVPNYYPSVFGQACKFLFSAGRLANLTMTRLQKVTLTKKRSGAQPATKLKNVVFAWIVLDVTIDGFGLFHTEPCLLHSVSALYAKLTGCQVQPHIYHTDMRLLPIFLNFQQESK